jgi:hypothetical protein
MPTPPLDALCDFVDAVNRYADAKCAMMGSVEHERPASVSGAERR